ncbi:MAG: hypothetical protein KDC87_06075 [Planctomycetes bacterium]|nr:hypothetical protein [Planctomycetota bacterium]
MQHTGERNLVLGTVRGYGFAQLQPFVDSLRGSGFGGTLVLFAAGLDAPTQQQLRARGVVLIDYDEREFPRQQIEIVCYRFLLYQAFLRVHGAEFDNVLLCDVRDVAFQRDPFDFPRPEGLCCFLEDRRMTIGSCAFNSRWTRDLFGPEVATRLAPQAISCAGTTLGSTAAVRDYVDQQVEYFLSLPVALLGTDQAHHNFMIYSGMLPQLTLFPNESGPVMTLGYRPPELLVFDTAGRLRNDVGQIVSTIHQYDRHPGRFPRFELPTGAGLLQDTGSAAVEQLERV